MLPIIFHAWCQCPEPQEESNATWIPFSMLALIIITILWNLSANNSGDGCFHGSNRVTMYSGNHKRCDEIVKGDVVLLSNNQPARVRCVAKILNNSSSNIRLLKFPCGLIITDYHPIKIKSWWCFPKNIASAAPFIDEFDAVYSFLLEMDDGSSVKHGLQVQGIECAPLGHNITDDIVRHNFFGNFEAVKAALINVSPEQFDEGLVEITNMQRGPEGEVCGFLFQP